MPHIATCFLFWLHQKRTSAGATVISGNASFFRPCLMRFEVVLVSETSRDLVYFSGEVKCWETRLFSLKAF